MDTAIDKAGFKSRVDRAVFIVWAAPTFGSPRSRLLARELNLPEPVYLYSNRLKKPWTAPLRYIFQGVQTLWLLFRRRPSLVLVQSPPSFAVLVVALYCVLTNSRYIVDAHSDAFQRAIWTRPAWLYRQVSRRALATLVTDDFFRLQLERAGARALVLRDPVVSVPVSPPERNGSFHITVVNTFNFDEPLQEVLQAAAGLPGVRFSVTGKLTRADPALLRQAPPNVAFTDFLPDADYHKLLCSSQAVLSLTTRDHTLQCGACEALSRKRPVITSDWPLLREYFSQGTVYVDNTASGIRRGIEDMLSEYERYEGEIAGLFALRHAEWQQRITGLNELISIA